MNFNEYQEEAQKTVIYPKIFIQDEKGNQERADWIYPTYSAAGELGELLNLLKKVIRDDKGKQSPDLKEKIKCELGGLIWYTSAICTEFNLSLDEVAQANINKLKSRQARGKLSGSGDNR